MNTDMVKLLSSLALVEGVDYWRIGRQRWKLLLDVEVFIRGRVFRVKAGYEWDGCSIPAFARFYATPGEYLLASLIHDHCYQYHWLEEKLCGVWCRVKISKGMADSFFFAILEHFYGVRITKAKTMWLAVHFGGWKSWLCNTCNQDCELCPCDAGGWCPEQPDWKTEDRKNGKTERRKDGTTACKALATGILLLFATGCAWSFNGKREIGWKINLPGLGVECLSKVDGAYAPTGAKGATLTPEQQADAMLPIIREAIIKAAQAGKEE